MITTELLIPQDRNSIIHIPRAIITGWQVKRNVDVYDCSTTNEREYAVIRSITGNMSFISDGPCHFYPTGLESFTIKEMLAEINRRLDG